MCGFRVKNGEQRSELCLRLPCPEAKQTLHGWSGLPLTGVTLCSAVASAAVGLYHCWGMTMTGHRAPSAASARVPAFVTGWPVSRTVPSVLLAAQECAAGLPGPRGVSLAPGLSQPPPQKSSNAKQSNHGCYLLATCPADKRKHGLL